MILTFPRLQVTVDADGSFSAALREYILSRDRANAAEDAVNKAMQFLVSFVMGKMTVGSGHVADKARIEGRLMEMHEGGKFASDRLPRKLGKKGKEAKTARYLALRNTRAAYLVWITNYKGARSMDAGKFWGTVGRYVAARKYSAGYHRAGFLPALNVYRGKRGLAGRMPKYKLPGGTASPPHMTTPDFIRAVMENFTRFIEGLGVPALAAEALADVEQQLRKWTAENLIQSMTKKGMMRAV